MIINEREFEIALARKGTTSIEVARELGLHHSTLSRFKRGHYPIPKEMATRLAEILEISTNLLFEKNSK